MEVSGLSRPLSVWLSHHVRPPEKTMDREHVGVDGGDFTLAPGDSLG